MRGRAKRIAGALAVLLLVLTVPALWVETACTTPREPGTLTRAPLVADPGYARREADSHVSYPAWHLVWAHEDLAAVLRRGDPSDYAYGRQIAGFWRSLCAVTRAVTARGRVGAGTRLSLYATGWRFTTEMALKAAYEKTLGRLFEWVRGPGKTAEDEFAAREMQSYAEFLRRAPWHEYSFGWRLLALWRGTPLRGDDLARKLERRAVVSLEYATKAICAGLVGAVSRPRDPDPEIHTVVVGLDPAAAAREPRLQLVRELGEGRTLIRTPRDQAFTELMVRLARGGGEIVEIAGNHRILMTVRGPGGSLPPAPGVTVLFEVPIQSRPDRRRVGLDVSVEHLTAAIRALEPAGTTIERIHPY